MTKNNMDAKELSRVYDEVSEDTGRFREMIEKSAMDHEAIDKILAGFFDDDQKYPELAAVEDMTPADFAELYGKMSEEIIASQEKFEPHAKSMGMEPGELSVLFKQISGGIQKYPEVWESKDKAQILHPRNLIMLATAFKENASEAFGKIKGVSDEE